MKNAFTSENEGVRGPRHAPPTATPETACTSREDQFGIVSRLENGRRDSRSRMLWSRTQDAFSYPRRAVNTIRVDSKKQGSERVYGSRRSGSDPWRSEEPRFRRQVCRGGEGTAMPREPHLMRLFLNTCAVVMALLCAVSARASSIDQLRQRLASLQGTTPVAGEFLIDEEDNNSDKQRVRRGSVEFECDPATLRLALPAGDLSRAIGPKGRDEVAEIDVHVLWTQLNAATSLLEELSKATVIGEQASRWKARPATRLEVSVKLDRPEDAPRMLKLKSDIRRIFWLAPDGTPLAAEVRGTVSARFLLISGSSEVKISEEYEVIGDRLVLVLLVDDSSSVAMGEKGRKKTTTTVLLRK